MMSFFQNIETKSKTHKVAKVLRYSISTCSTNCNWGGFHLSLSLLISLLSTFQYNMFINNRFLRERGMPSNPKMEYQFFLCIFQKNSAMATLGLKEMGKFLWDGREKSLPSWLSQFSFAKLRQSTGQTLFPIFQKEFSHFLQT